MRKEWVWATGAFAVAAYMIFMNLGAVPLINPDEGRNASIAWEMSRAGSWAGSWLVPSYDGLAYLDKPAFFFKAGALCMTLFGKNAFAARLPSALSAMGLLGVVYAFCRREYSPRVAALAVAVTATSPLYFVQARYVIFDMMLTFFVCGAIFAGYYAELTDGAKRKRWYRLFAAAVGFALLVKGPVGFAVPVLVLVAFNALEKRKGALGRLLSLENFTIMLALFLPWFVGVSLIHHNFPYYGVVRETLLRFTTNEFHRDKPFYFYPPVLLATLLFWSFTIPQGAWRAWKWRASLTRTDRFLIVWILTVVAFFSISQSKLPGYVLSATVALAILIARIFATAFERQDTQNKTQDEAWAAWPVARNAGLALAGVCLLLAGTLVVWHANPGLFKIPLKEKSAWPVLHAMFVPSTIFFTAMAVLAAGGALRRSAALVFLTFLIFPLTLPQLALPAVIAVERQHSDRMLAAKIKTLAPPGAEIACLYCFPDGLTFYLGHDITLITRYDGAEIESNYIPFNLATAAKWPPQVISAKRQQTWLAAQTKPVFLLARKGQAKRLAAIAKNHCGVKEFFIDGYYRGVLLPPLKKLPNKPMAENCPSFMEKKL
jgi:4-amino-4-deoxy-L-arabinose transferase-like glycosyltransferase